MVDELREKIFEAQPSPTASAPATLAVPQPQNAASTQTPTPAPPIEEPKPVGKFTIQVVTVTSQAIAERELKKFTAKGHKGFVIPSGKYLQICVDGFESKDKASQRMKQLKTSGIVPQDAYVRAFA